MTPGADLVALSQHNSRFLPREGDWLRRAAVLDEADGELASRAILLDAPAGYGKTVLLAQIAGELERKGWPVSFVDASDRDFDCTGLLRAMRKSGAERQALVIDNLDRAEAPAFDVLQRLIREQAENSAIVLAGRGYGALPAEDLRLARKLRVYRPYELAFSEPEIEALIGQSGSNSAGSAAAMLRATLGWPAAVATHLEEPAHLEGRVAGAFRRYMQEQIFGRLSERERDTISAAAVLDSFSQSSLAAVVGEPGWSASLASVTPIIEGANDSRRLHPLYRNFVLGQLNAGSRRKLQAIHGRAARWFDEIGDRYRAASHAMESGDPELIVQMLDRGARHYIAGGYVAEAQRWLEDIRDIDSMEMPRVRLYRATALVVSQQREAALREHQALVEMEEAARAAGTQPPWLAEVAARNRWHVFLLAFYAEEPAIDREVLESMCQEFRDAGLNLGGELAVLLGMFDLDQGHVDRAEAILVGAQDGLRRSASWLAFAYGMIALARIDGWFRSSGQAAHRLEGLLEELADVDLAESPAADFVRQYLAYFRLSSGDPAGAAAAIDRISEAETRIVDRDQGMMLDIVKAGLAASGSFDAARERLLKALVAQDPETSRARRLRMALVRLYLAKGDIQRAREAFPRIDVMRLPHERPSRHEVIRLEEQIVDQMIALQDAGSEVDLSTVRLLLKRARTLGIRPLIAEALMTVAVANARSDYSEDALRAAREAVEIARQAECGGRLGDFPLPAAKVLLNQVMLGDPELEPFVRGILEGRSDGSASRRPEAPGQIGRQNILTSREREVLLLISLGHSNQRIAEMLVMSLATVKWHVRNILSKLDASNRSDAVAKARIANIIN